MDEQMIDFKQRIAEHLRICRKAAGYKSAKDFAAVLGLQPTAYREYEQGRSSLTYNLAWRIADILDISLDELAGRIAPGLSKDQAELVSLFNRCNDQRKQRLIEEAQDSAQLSEGKIWRKAQ